MSDLSYTVSQSFIQAGLIGIMFLILPYFGFFVGLTAVTGTVIVFMLATAKILTFMILKLMFGIGPGGMRDTGQMLLSAVIVLLIMWMFGIAVFDVLGLIVLVVVFMLADILAHMLLISSRASRRS